MAKLPKGIFGPFSGKIGPVVGATWNGIAYLRAAPKKNKNRPKSEAQIANEMKFKFVNEWMVPFHPYVTIGFRNLPVGKMPISTAFSVNYHLVITGVYPDLGIDYTKVVLSLGDLPGLNQPVMALIAPDTLEIKWQQNTNPKASFDDQLMLILYSPVLHVTDGFIGGVKRRAKKCSFQFDPALIGKVLEVYISITSLDGKKTADSMYLGRIEP